MKKKTKWPLMVLLLVLPGAALTYWSPDLISSAAPSVEQAAAVEVGAVPPAPPHVAAGLPQYRYGWNLGAPQPTAVEEPATQAQPVAAPPIAQPQSPSSCRKYLRTQWLPAPKAAPKGGLLDQPTKTTSAAEAKTIAILNQRIRNADECLKRAAPAG